MEKFRFIHAADLHLDSPFKGLSGLPDSLRDRIQQSTFTALDRLVALALRERVDFMVISGDVYDAKDRSLRAQLRFQQALRTLADAGVRVFVAHGNHDPLNEGYRAELAWPDGVTIFGSEEVRSEVVTRADGRALARVSGISFGRAAVHDNLTPGFRPADDGLYHIGVLHTNVDGDAAHGNYAPCTLKDLTGRGLDYWALGHVHTRCILHQSPWVVYPGNIQGRHIREIGPRGCYVAEVSVRGEAELTFHPLDDVRWQEEMVSIDDLLSEQQLKETLEAAVDAAASAADGRTAIVRIKLTGRGPMHAVLRRSGVLQDWMAALRGGRRDVWIEALDNRTGAPLDREALASQPGFLGDLLRLAGETVPPPALTEFADEALEPLRLHAPLASLLAETGEAEWAEWLAEAEELVLGLLAEGLDTGGRRDEN